MKKSWIVTAGILTCCSVIAYFLVSPSHENSLSKFSSADTIDSYTEVTNESNSPLHIAVQKNEIVEIKKLLDQGADINSRNRIGNTPLHLATGGQRLESLQLLIERGANLNMKNSWNGATPLMFAVVNENRTAVQALIKAGADVNIRNNNGETAAQMASPELADLF